MVAVRERQTCPKCGRALAQVNYGDPELGCWQCGWREARPAAPKQPGMKECQSCGRTQPLAAYQPSLSSRDGWSVWCRACLERNRLTKAKRQAEAGGEAR